MARYHLAIHDARRPLGEEGLTEHRRGLLRELGDHVEAEAVEAETPEPARGGLRERDHLGVTLIDERRPLTRAVVEERALLGEQEHVRAG